MGGAGHVNLPAAISRLQRQALVVSMLKIITRAVVAKRQREGGCILGCRVCAVGSLLVVWIALFSNYSHNPGLICNCQFVASFLHKSTLISQDLRI